MFIFSEHYVWTEDAVSDISFGNISSNIILMINLKTMKNEAETTYKFLEGSLVSLVHPGVF